MESPPRSPSGPVLDRAAVAWCRSVAMLVDTLELHQDLWYATAVAGATEKQFPAYFFVHDFGGVSAGSPYLTADEALAYLPSDTPLTGTAAAALAVLAQEIVETVTGEKFLAFTMARVFDGNGTGFQPVDMDIQEVSDIEVLWGTVWESQGTVGIRIGGSRKSLAWGNIVPFSRSLNRNDRQQRFFGSSGACGAFPAGYQNIRVTGVWGPYSSVPLQIKHAVGLLVQYSGSCLEAGEQGSPENPYLSEVVAGGRTWVLRTIFKAAQRDRGTGFADVDGILARFPGVMSVTTVT